MSRAVKPYDPNPDLRDLARRNSYDLLADPVAQGVPSSGDADTTGHLMWSTMHGRVSMELTRRARHPPRSRFLKPDDSSYDRVYHDGMPAILAGLNP